jgi:outer membrane immunogenic protein
MRILAMSATLLFSATLAQAADLASRPAEPAAPVAVPYSWTGLYVGVHGGGGWGRENDNQDSLFQPPPGVPGPGGVAKFDLDGFIGGGHLGYNYQIQQFVLGIEGDLDYASIKGSRAFSNNGGLANGSLSLKTDFQGSARLRAGYAIDNILLYTTGGVAFANARLSTSGVGSSETQAGWTVGGGVEYAITDNWLVRGEVRYTDFEKKTYQTLYGPVRADWNQTTAEVGASYKF